MRQLDRWLERQARRTRGMVFLEDALLTDRFAPYAVYRLRYFFLRYVVTSVVFGVKFLVLFELFSRDFVTLLQLQAVAGVIASSWWGGLEVMRERIRGLHRSGRTRQAPREIARWLSLAVRLAVVTTALIAVWLTWRILTEGRMTAADLYAVAIALRLAAGFVVRSYHSGVYALQRVYRPLRSMVAADAASFVGTLLLWPVIGRWGFPVATIIATAVSVTLSLAYTAKAYRFFGFAPERSVDLRRIPRLTGSKRELLLGGSAYGLMRLDALLVLGLFRSDTHAFEEAVLFTLFFALGPTVRAGFEWAQLFYFDLKRLDGPLLADLGHRFERQLGRLAWLVGLIFWTIACVVGTVIFQRSLGVLYLVTIPFFLIRSVLAASQMKAYAAGAYTRLLVSGGLAFVGFLVLGRVIPGAVGRLVGASVILLVAQVALRAIERGRRLGSAPEPLWAIDWIHRAAGSPGPIRVRSLRFWGGPHRRVEGERPWHDEQRWRYADLAGAMARELGTRGAVTYLAPDRLAWFEDAERAPLDDAWILTRGGGQVVDISPPTSGANGRRALSAATSSGVLGEDLSGRPARDEASLRRRFLELHPTGIVYEADGPSPDAVHAMTSNDRRRVVADALAFGRDLGTPAERSAMDVTSFFRQGRLRLIFILDRKVPRPVRARWRREMRAANLASALGRLEADVLVGD